MSRANKLQDKIEKGMNMLYENLPDDIAIFTYVYIRDKSDRSNNPDGDISVRVLNANMNMFDRYMTLQDIKELSNKIK